MKHASLAFAILVLLLPDGRARQYTSPREHLGREVGADFQLADWGEVSGYFERLARETPRVRTEEVGKTTEGRRFLLATIGSEANLARLDEIKKAAARIADPRGLDDAAKRAALAQCVPILVISNAMHSTETAAPQFAMELAYRLATSSDEPYRSAREKLLVLILPCTNPDGLDDVVSWYRKTVGTPHEGAALTKLYQHYAGHDNNRDWFMLTQPETRLVTKLLYSDWHPHVYWDVHQQGSRAERMFVPPFRDPLNPNLDPAVIAGIGALGSRALYDMTREGLAGVATGVSFDMWWNGGNRNVPVRHNIIGLLTEAASVNIASPIFLERSELRAPGGKGEYQPANAFPDPWPGGWWRLRDIIDYEHAFARSILRSLSAEPQTWLASALAAAERALAVDEAPYAWLIPSDNPDKGAVRRLIDTLLLGGVEIYTATTADGHIRAIRADGREYPTCTFVIPRRQPYGSHVKDLFDVQRYPEGEPPYDVAGWTLPFLLGVRRVEVMQDDDLGPLTRLSDLEMVTGCLARSRSEVQWSSANSDDWRQMFARLAQGEPVLFMATGPHAGSFVASGVEPGETSIPLARLPRLGVYSPWSGNIDEGWLRFVLDEDNVAYTTVRNEMLRAGALAQFLDVLVVPDVSSAQLDRGRAGGSVPAAYAGGLDPEGAIAIEEFVRGGGTLVTIGDSSAWAIDLFELPLVDVTREKQAADFSCPGSVLRTIPAASAPLTAGLPESLAVFFSRSSAWRPMTADERKEKYGTTVADDRALDVLLRYAPTRVLMSGWIKSPATIEGKAAWVRAAHGHGRVHLFAFSPQYRGWSQDTFQLLFRAIVLNGS
jgi:hypothetical protein